MVYGMDYEIILPCSGGYYLCIDGDHLIISKISSEEIIPISHILSFSIKNPGAFFSGSVTIKTAQSATGSVSFGHGISLAVGAEKTFNFAEKDFETARKIREYVIDYNTKHTSAASLPSCGVISVVDEIRGLKGLLDDGILTQEEFDLQKRSLLDLQAKRSI